MPLRLNLGCGRTILDGWINVDAVALPGVDVVADLDRCRTAPLPFDDASAGEFLLSHVLEHLSDPLPLMQELHRIAAPGALATIRCPYGSGAVRQRSRSATTSTPGSARIDVDPAVEDGAAAAEVELESHRARRRRQCSVGAPGMLAGRAASSTGSRSTMPSSPSQS